MDQLEKKFAVHQAIVGERFRSIQESLERGKDRMRTIELQLYAVILAVLFGPGVAAEFVKKLLGL
jgi:hypothetical protein